MSEVSTPDMIALVKCEYRDPDLRRKFQPMWVRLQDDGHRVITVYQEFAWIVHPEKAVEVADDCNNDPEWQTIRYSNHGYTRPPIQVVYSVVEYLEYKWQSMDNAPVDKPILTDVGIVCHVDQADWGSPVTSGWYLCDPNSDVLSCAEERMLISLVTPKLWMHLPVPQKAEV